MLMLHPNTRGHALFVHYMSQMADQSAQAAADILNRPFTEGYTIAEALLNGMISSIGALRSAARVSLRAGRYALTAFGGHRL